MNHPAQTSVVEAVASRVLGALDSEATSRRQGAEGAAAADTGSGWSGGSGVVASDELPMAGAEDFSYFLMPEHGGKPGCFFFLGGFEEELGGLSAITQSVAVMDKAQLATPGAFASKEATSARRSNCICHGTSFDFNDNLIPRAAVLWVRLVEARLGFRLFQEEELSPKAVLDAAATAATALLA
jgi:hippurate hydrolase